MKQSLRRAVESIENAPLTLTTFALTSFGIIVCRFTIENILTHYHASWYFFEHEYFFYMLTLLASLLLIRATSRATFEQASNVALFGFLIIIAPPLIDLVISGGKGYMITYLFTDLPDLIHRFFTFYGDTLDKGITYGVRIEMLVVIFGSSLYVWLKTRSAWRTLINALSFYVLLFILATLPSLVTILTEGPSKGFMAVSKGDVIGATISPTAFFGFTPVFFLGSFDIKVIVTLIALFLFTVAGLLWSWRRDYFLALWGNARVPQLFYHAGLLILGMLLAQSFTDTWFPWDIYHILGLLILIMAVEFTWLASVVVNDLYDIKIDTKTNSFRPLIKNTVPKETYTVFGVFFFLASLSFTGFFYPSIPFFLLVYHALAWIYSAPPLRLKRFPIVATVIAGIAGILIVLIGFVLVAPDHHLHDIPLSILSFLFVGYALSLPIKDFKDIEGDRSDGVYTIPVLLGAEKGKIVIGGLLLLLFLLSPLVLHARVLFWPALLFGVLVFATLQKGTDKESDFFAFRKLPGIVLALTGAYGLAILFLLF